MMLVGGVGVEVVGVVSACHGLVVWVDVMAWLGWIGGFVLVVWFLLVV